MSEQEEREQLIQMLKSENSNAITTALDKLRRQGWLNYLYLDDLSHANLEHASLGEVDLSTVKFTGANLHGANFYKTNLYQANLFGANLTFAYLRWANLAGANLRNVNAEAANLFEANMNYAFLTGACLRSAELSGVDLRKAELSETDMSKARLYGTHLSGANLQYANLSEAECDETIFANVDLSTVKGLETVKHSGPSTIGFDTIYNSKGRIPEIFLRGCGVPENLITYLPSLLNQAVEFYSCFISYSHVDKSFARRVHDTLQGRGIRCWLDEKQMKPGDDIYTEIERGIRYWDKVLICCSKDSLTSWWVDHELDRLFEKERQLMKDRGEKVLALIPLDVDGYLFSSECNNPKTQQIRSRIAANFMGWEHDNTIFEEQIERVIKALRTDGGKEPLPKSKL